MYPLLRITDTLYLPTYFVAMAIAYSLAVYYLYQRTLKHDLDIRIAMDLSLVIMVSGFLGSRLLHIFYEAPDFYRQFPLEALKFWQGGFVFYGGFILSSIAVIGYLNWKKQNLWEWADTLAPTIALGYIVGRLGTLLSGSGYGRPTELPWAIVYPPGSEAPSGIALHPTPLYAMLLETLTLITLLILERKNASKNFLVRGQLFAIFLIGHGIGRGIVEQFRDDARGAFWLGLSVSTWISLVVVIVGAGLFLKLRLQLKPKSRA